MRPFAAGCARKENSLSEEKNMDGLTSLELDEIFGRESAPAAAVKLDEATIDPDDIRPYVPSRELEKLSEGQFSKTVAPFSWNEIVSASPQPLEKDEKPKDGMTEERCGRQNWRYFHKDGKCIRIELQDPDIAGGKMLFDGDGNEIAA